MKLRLTIFLLANLILLNSCMTSSVLQTAQTQEQRTIEYTFSPSVIVSNGMYWDIIENNGYSYWIYCAQRFRYGILDNLDFGLRFNLIATTGAADVKWNVYSSADDKLYFSTGLQFNYGFVDENTMERTLSIPLYLSYGDHDDFAFYTSFKVGAFVDNFRTLKYGSNPLAAPGSLMNCWSYSGAFGITFNEADDFLEFSFFNYHLQNIYHSSFYVNEPNTWQFKNIIGFQLSYARSFDLDWEWGGWGSWGGWNLGGGSRNRRLAW